MNAAGAWAGGVARLAGAGTLVSPFRRQVAVTVPSTTLPPSFPMTVWTADGFHLRVRDDRVLLLRPTSSDEISPDLHVLLGPARGCPSLLLANGSSGHGVMHAPAIGQLIAEIATHGRALALDITALRPSRFVEGDPVRGGTLL